NVILSLDDSGSMGTTMYSSSGKWLGTRTQVLQNALTDVFSDQALLPDGKIRLAWQVMNNSNKKLAALGTNAAASTTSSNAPNLMRVLDTTHRTNFLSYVKNGLQASGNTPTHLMVQRAHDYMSAPLHQNGPWATNPGE